MQQPFVKDLKRSVKRLLGPTIRAYGQKQNSPSPETWGLTANGDRGLSLEGVQLHELLERFGSPLHVVQAAKLRENARLFSTPPAGHPAGVEVYYSYKTNPIPGVLMLLHELGIGAEVISPFELWLARRLGVPARKIIYNGPAKTDDSLREAISADIELINCNHREEIARVAALAAECGRKPRVGIRVTTSAAWSSQFGVPIADGAALETYREALRHPSLQLVGLHAHRGGMIRHESEVAGFVKEILAFCEQLRTELGVSLEMLDLGGSLGTPTVCGLNSRDYRLSQTFLREIPGPDVHQALTIDAYVRSVVERVAAHYQRLGTRQPRILLEPGRAMTGNSQLLLTRVLTTKAEQGRNYAIMDAGINLAESVRSEFHQVFPVNRHAEPARTIYAIVGPICSPGDTLYNAVRLPDLQPGDSLAIMDAGAYFVPFSTSFSFPKPGIVMLDEGRARVIRQAEDFEALIGRDVDLPAPASK